ncbi:pRiA4b ORF-3-like protein [Saccharicrinis carchari]|uniref:PRiA4b ORF-3-like protein n=1 Tax=Saccharicrinis carchari TaxID=1168039 RepID=A0A521ARK7_SACCC|nr:plasmid pRiA4b ORF-3 family protein [Saccharicrinis carchari]SMO37458.1 pRiA4b ORF-3-like protein [Saccharicrinis carchari]
MNKQSIYHKNYIENGYLMNYEKPPKVLRTSNQVYQFKIELLDIFPTIWRRILVPADYNFWDLHMAIQDAMGWTGSHLHHFEIKGKGKRRMSSVGVPNFYNMHELPEIFPGWEISMHKYFNDLGEEAKYMYDYGDGWVHSVKLEGFIFREKKVKYPHCIGGERACPPEDCGGVPGYQEVIETLSNPYHSRHRDMRIWVGENWDAEKFNPSKVFFHDPYKIWKQAFLET